MPYDTKLTIAQDIAICITDIGAAITCATSVGDREPVPKNYAQTEFQSYDGLITHLPIEGTVLDSSTRVAVTVL